MQWLTTSPNPRAHAVGVDAGQRGWRLHAVIVPSTAPTPVTFQALRWESALCGLRPAHGWGLDMFIEDRCKRCEARAARLGIVGVFR